ncbi:MAG TPA: ABC transporter ATP-binding protein [Terriglobia bacterium]|nr:ABC transporter ATP-binding protein [Terriglobia bacterium]
MEHPAAKVRRFKIWDLLKPHSTTLALGLLAAVGEGVANLLEPWPLKIVLDSVLRAHRPVHGWLNRLILAAAGEDKIAILKLVVAAVLLIALLDAVCSYTEKYLTTSVSQRVTHDLRRALYAHIQRLSLAYHDRKQTGDLISRVTTDIDAVQTFIASAVLGGLINCVTLAGMVAVMFYINWRFTLVALSVAPVLFVIVYSYTRRIKQATREVRKKEGEIVSLVQEVLSSIRVVKAFAREDYEQRRLEEESWESVEIALHARGLKAKLSPIVDLIVALGTCLVFWFGAGMVLAGALSAGSLIVFIWYLGKMYKPMQELSKMTDTYSKAAIGYERIREVLETNGLIQDARGARLAPQFKGKVEFAHVHFSYTPGTPVLKDVCLRVEPGQLTALVGPTGAGKTTIISLLARFYDPDSGVVKIDGHDIRRFQHKSLRGRMSFVLQETLLFHAPVWQNIAYGKPEARRAEVLRAAKFAHAHEFIEKLPDGYDTVVGERGLTLSGGERQRIAIARAVIRNTPLLILDEPTSGLDAASEQLVFEALDRLMAGKTCMVIAHRLSTIRRADAIFVVKDGMIAERGTHEELLKAGGLYAELYEIQFRKETEESGMLLGQAAS